MLMNNLFLGTTCATIFTGTLYPLILDVVGGGIVSVGPPYFNATVTPLMLPVFVLMAIGPFLRWESGDLRTAIMGLRYAFLLSISGLVGGLYIYGFKSILGLVALTLGLWLLTGTISEARRYHRLALLAQIPRLLAHGGLGIAILGMSGSAFSTEHDLTMHLHETRQIEDYSLEFADLVPVEGANFQAARGLFHITHKGSLITMQPEQRYYPVQGSSMTDVAIHTNFIGDLYLAMGEEQTEADGSTSRVVRFHINPLVPWIWIGGTIMALGGVWGFLRRQDPVKGLPQ